MRGLIHAGLELDIFPVHPLDPVLWRYVPDVLNEQILPKSRVHHVPIRRVLPGRIGRLSKFLKYTAPIGVSALRYGIGPVAKTAYVLLKGLAAAQEYRRVPYDHILAYWGSYAATYAYVFRSLTNQHIPISMFLHAGDLYQDQVYLDQKLLHSNNIFVVCEFNREFIKKHYQDIFDAVSNKIHVYHPSLDLAELEYEPSGVRERKVLAVGRFDRCKGFDYLLRAVSDLTHQGIDVDVELIGDGDEASLLKSLADKLGIRKNVKFRGWLPFGEVKTAMRQACMLVHPASELGDAVPTVIKEALAIGTPVIASNVAGIPELLDYGRCGILVPPRDVLELGNAIKTLLADETTCRKLVEKARAFAEEHFDLWRNGARLATILRASSDESTQ